MNLTWFWHKNDTLPQLDSKWGPGLLIKFLLTSSRYFSSLVMTSEFPEVVYSFIVDILHRFSSDAHNTTKSKLTDFSGTMMMYSS